MFRAFALTISILLLTACARDPGLDDDGVVDVLATREGAESCHSATPVDPMQWKKPCTEELCVPERWSVRIATASSEELPCFTAGGERCGTQKNQGGFFYRAEAVDGHTSIEIGFDAKLGDDFSEATLSRTFGAIYVGLVVGRGSLDARIEHMIWRQFRRDDLKNLSFEGNLLTATAEFRAEEIIYDLRDIDGACLEGDIVLNCQCRFEGIDLPATIAFQVALAATER